MAHIGTLRDFRFKSDDIDDIRGSDLYGRDDEKLGEIDDVIFDHATGECHYAVVDTGGWLSSRKFLVPADRLHERAGHEDDFAVDLTKAEVERFPKYDERNLENENDWREYETSYNSKWEETGGVMHKEGGVNIITPEADEMPAATRGSAPNTDVTPTRLAGKFTDTAPGGGKIRMRPAGAASDAEDSKFPGKARETREPSRTEDEIGSERDRSMVDSSSRSFGGDVTGRVPEAETRRKDLDNINAGDVGYGDVNRTAVPSSSRRDLPPSYRESALDPSNDLHRPYPVQQGRPARWRSFEERLREHRHDATSSCNVCRSNKDRAA